MKLDAGPWTRREDPAQGSKHVLWIAVRAMDRFHLRRLLHADPRPGARASSRRSTGTAGKPSGCCSRAGDLGQRGFLREQVCRYMCPRALQSAMFDRNTLIIAYDPMREPRGPFWQVSSVLQRARPASIRRPPTIMCSAPPATTIPHGQPRRTGTMMLLGEGTGLKAAPAEVLNRTNSATASTARCACRSAQSASTSRNITAIRVHRLRRIDRRLRR